MAKSVIAIDGPAASGKSTVASQLAGLLRIPYINTGNMYRAVALDFLRRQIDIANIADVSAALEDCHVEYRPDSLGGFKLYLNGTILGDEIRNSEVASMASKVAAIGQVREHLKTLQRDSAKLGLIVMEGRDIGTEIFPDAQWKFFVTASPLVRAVRRLAQAGEMPDGATLESVAREIAERDERDSKRAVAPLKAALDAELIDSSDLSIAQVVDHIVKKVEAGR